MSMTPRMLQQRGGGARRPSAGPRWQEFEAFRRGMNQVDARTAIADDEAYWLENMIPIGAGALQVLNGPGDAVATISVGIASLWGFTLNGAPVHIAINRDGSVTQVTPGGATTNVATANSVDPSDAVCTIWRGTTILILSSLGYVSWDGTTFTVISTTQTGAALVVGQGRAWLISERTITYTAPNTYNDFTAGNGAGSTILTDEAFDGNVVAAVSALEQIWLVGNASVEALSNVSSSGTAPNVVTVFALTNIVPTIGTTSPQSLRGYFRALTFLAPYGAYALSGVTPQQLSEKLDGLFPSLTIDDTVSACVAIVKNLLCLIYRVQYTGQALANGAGPISLLLVFNKGRWCLAYQGAVTWVTTLIVGGVAQAWATDGTTIFRLFGAADTVDVTAKMVSKLHSFGSSMSGKFVTRAAVEVESSRPISPTLTIDSLYKSEAVTLTTTAELTWQTTAGGIITFINAGGQDLAWQTQGPTASRVRSAMYGTYIGWTYQVTGPPHRVQKFALEVVPARVTETRQK